MIEKKKKHPQVKSSLHPRNKHRQRYDFKLLINSCPELSKFVSRNQYGDDSIDFFNPEAVKTLNKALLKHYYNINNWDIPKNYLCPPIPGRADYIHHIADLLTQSNKGKMPKKGTVTCLDIGIGANCVYPIIGSHEYGWSFIGSDIETASIKSADKIIQANPKLKEKVELRLQQSKKQIFKGIIKKDEFIDLTICNPPFHSSEKEAQSGSIRKLKNLKGKKVNKVSLNFGGQSNELWCDGGEAQFVKNMVHESKQFRNSCFWFSTLISKEASLKTVYKELKQAKAREVKTIDMGQGNKKSRIVAWTYLTPEQQTKWAKFRWNG